MKDQELISEVYYSILQERAQKTFDELTTLFKKLTGNKDPQLGDEYVYKHNDSTFKIVKAKDGFNWGRWWQGQLWGRFINQYSTSNVKDNEKLVEFLKNKPIKDLEDEFPEIKGTLT